MRVGIGYDIHALKAGRPLILGGVRIPHPKGLTGHSDGDALLHAIVDATLGAAAAGDIGSHFPDTDPRHRGADSRRFVRGALEAVARRKLRVSSIDSVVVAEAPKLAAHREAMRRSIAAAFGVPVSAVGVKAKTNEGFGEIGARRAIACWAVVTLRVRQKAGRTRPRRKARRGRRKS